MGKLRFGFVRVGEIVEVCGGNAFQESKAITLRMEETS